MAESEASSLSLAAPDGGSELILRSRALPYRPITIGGKQRMEFTWYPGSPSATVQMLGPEEAPITMSGFWKDRFIGGQFPGSDSVGFLAVYNGDWIDNVSDLVDIVDAMRRSGRTYMFSWDRLQRYGHIANFECRWHNTHDVEWTLEFAVTAQEQRAAALPQVNLATPQRTATALQAAEATLIDDLVPAFFIDNPIPFSNAWLSAIAEFEDSVTALTNNITQTANKIVNGIMAYPDGARRMVGTLGRSINSVAATATTITDRAVGEYFNFVGGQDNSPIGQQVSASSYQTQISNYFRGLQATTVFGRYDMQQQLQDSQSETFLATNDTDFRDIATQFYGSQDQWIWLMRFNGYDDSKVAAGDLIWVPRQPTSGTVGSGGDY